MNLMDIAEKAGVSSTTVSNVINGNYHKVSQNTIERVQKIIDECGYKPNATARSLASKQSKIIGVVVPYLGENEVFSISPYNTQILAMLENYIRKQGYYLMMRTVGGCDEIIPFFSSWNVDGLIVFGANEAESSMLHKKIKVPTVYIDTYTKEKNIVNIGIDDYKGGYLSARYLLGKGHRSIAFAGPNIQMSEVIGNRYRGYCDACEEFGVKVSENDCFEAMTYYEEGVEVGKQIAFADKKYTAVLVMSDILALGVMEGLRLCGYHVPEDISVIGFDNLPECKYSNPQLTTVSQNLEEKARLVGERLFEMINKKKEVACRNVVEVEIVERQSVKQLI